MQWPLLWLLLLRVASCKLLLHLQTIANNYLCGPGARAAAEVPLVSVEAATWHWLLCHSSPPPYPACLCCPPPLLAHQAVNDQSTWSSPSSGKSIIMPPDTLCAPTQTRPWYFVPPLVFWWVETRLPYHSTSPATPLSGSPGFNLIIFCYFIGRSDKLVYKLQTCNNFNSGWPNSETNARKSTETCSNRRR